MTEPSKLPRQRINASVHEAAGGQRETQKNDITGSERETRSSTSCFLSYFCQSERRHLTSFPNHTRTKHALLLPRFLFFREKFCCMSFLTQMCFDCGKQALIPDRSVGTVWDRSCFYLFIYEQQVQTMMADVKRLTKPAI